MWITTAWQNISLELTVKGYKCCILCVVDGTDSDLLWGVGGECEGDGGTECESGESDTRSVCCVYPVNSKMLFS
jgi:hypothetical protein